ncbi:uncharacterized protein LOC111714506 isoform X6 [Eurytemora carolleeae]|uniref:uncharacterized protein LOC111714506 isoform X6 n=1 Tax=Eurytemora carolleeae TaxID=1294199 RepID=UPI000C7587C6|nr:uncharacterized protein LOC111714506 isoform X6 [Eurytemora carolleeae]|eukprot:XP_023345409.1 uncharacterized protein LOC111714506 isoform X6 [Eurytemora affinis]
MYFTIKGTEPVTDRLFMYFTIKGTEPVTDRLFSRTAIMTKDQIKERAGNIDYKERASMIGDASDVGPESAEGLLLGFCRNSSDLGEKIECPHQFGRCYYGNVTFRFPGDDIAEPYWIRGCGGAKPTSQVQVHGSTYLKEYIPDSSGDKYFAKEGICEKLPHPWFPDITRFFFGNLSRDPTYEHIKDHKSGLRSLQGEICLCNREFCNGSDGLKSVTVFMYVIFLCVVY